MPDPWEYFDLMAGTGTGAICAIMLGRLRMSVDDSIKAYAKLASDVYGERKAVVSSGSGVFRATKLEECLKAIIEKQTGDPDERMMEENSRDIKCKVVVYAMSAHNMNAGLPCPFRTYPANANAMPDCPIWKALRASTAHPELFKSIEISELGVGQYYVGGGLGCSNPTSQLLKEASAMYLGRVVGSVVSIGTGHARTIQMTRPSWRERLSPHSIPRVLQVAHDLATDNERVAEEMAIRFSEANGIYHRLNVNQGMQSIEPSEWERQNEVAGHTTAYMLQAETSRLVDAIVERVRKRDGVAKTHHIDGRAVLSTTQVAVAFVDCPPPTPLFTGRTEDIAAIGSYFERSNRAQKVFVLVGLGGAGKTQTALKSAELLTPKQVRQRLNGKLMTYNLETALGAFAASKRIGNAYIDALRWLGCRDMSWLVLYDNVDDPEVRIHEYFPRSSRYCVLVTTRRLEVARLAQDESARRNISELEPEDAFQLLLKEAGLSADRLQDSEKTVAMKLLKKLGYLALAISQCGAYVCRNRCSIEQYHNLLVAEPQEMLGVTGTSTMKGQGYERSVHLTWEISYKQVGAPSKRVLGLAAFFHRDYISEKIFRRAFLRVEMYQPAVPLTDAETHAQNEVKDVLQLFADRKGSWSSRLFLETMGELVCLSLVIFDTLNHVYQLHPLVQEWIRALAPDISAAIERSAFLLALSIDGGDSGDDYSFRREIIPLIHEIVGLCPTPSSNNAWQFIRAYDEAGQVDKYEQLELQVLETRIRTLGREHPDTLTAMCYVAGTHSTKMRPAQAIKLYSEVLAVQQRVLGRDHIDTIATMRGLGLTYHEQNRLAEAEALQTETLAICKRLFGDEHPETLKSMSILAATYRPLGRLVEAEALHNAALTAYKRVLGDNHPLTLTSLANLGVERYNQGRYAEAEALQLEALATQRRVLGDGHPDTLSSAGNLAWTYFHQGRLSEAEVLQVATLVTRKQVLGYNHPHTVNTMRHLTLIYKTQGRQAEYDELMTQVNAISTSS